jgi:hypothetical protein
MIVAYLKNSCPTLGAEQIIFICCLIVILTAFLKMIEYQSQPKSLHLPLHLPMTWLRACRTRRGGATNCLQIPRCGPWGRGRAIGTCPRGHPVRAHR